MRAALVAMALVAAATSLADSWGPPQEKWTSKNGKFAVRRNEEYWKDLYLTLVDLTGSKPRDVWKITSPQERAPVRVEISSDGKYVVLIDQHHGLGYGKTLAFIGPSGRTLKTYTLNDIIPGSESLNAMTSVSSIWWGGDPAYIRGGKNQFVIFSAAGTLRAFELSTGNRIRLNESQDSEIRDEAAKPYRSKLNGSDEGQTAALKLGRIRDKKSAPNILKLIDQVKDPSTFCRAYVNILGDEAAPEFERRAFDPKYAEHKQHWIGFMPDGPKGKAAIRRIISSNPEDIVKHAHGFLWEVITAEDVRKNPSWLESKEERTRFAAVRALCEKPIASDLQVIERVLKSKDDIERVWALRALIAIRPNDLLTRLQDMTKNIELSGYEEAMFELARLDDKKATEEIREHLAKNPKDSPFLHLFAFQELCNLVVEKRYAWASAMLSQYRDARENWGIHANGALACFGDAQAIEKTRQSAKKGNFLDRNDAMDWLVRANDPQAKEILTAAADDDDPSVARTARENLLKLSGAVPGGEVGKCLGRIGVMSAIIGG